MEAQKIIIDTDIGDDIDDAFAIAFAVRCPEIDLLGVTTVFKNTAKRARIAKRLLDLAGRGDVPVHAGCAQPLAGHVNEGETPCQYTPEFCDCIDCNMVDAVDFLIDTLMNSNGDIALVTIGPLTNIAAALSKEPCIRGKIREIVMMAGAYYRHCNEWNIVCDPEAARTVFDSGVCIKAVGLDVTTKVVLRPGDMERVLRPKDPMEAFLATLLEKWRSANNRPDLRPMLHDPLAVFAVFDRKVIGFSREDVFVELAGEFTRGVTFLKYDVWGPKPTSNTSVAKSVQKNKFLDFYLERTFPE